MTPWYVIELYVEQIQHQVRGRLLKEADLTLQKASDICRTK